MIRARADSRRATSRRLSRRLLAHLDTGRTPRALTRVLREQTRPFLPNGPVNVAIDFPDVPYYGETMNPDQPQFIMTQESRGTHRAYHYATVDLLSPNLRFTVALRYLRGQGPHRRTVARLLAEARRTDVQVRRLYIDREFYECETSSWLKAKGTPSSPRCASDPASARSGSMVSAPTSPSPRSETQRAMKRRSHFGSMWSSATRKGGSGIDTEPSILSRSV